MRFILSAGMFIVFFLSFPQGKGGQRPSAASIIEEPLTIEARLLNRSEDSLVQVEFTLKMGKNIHIFSSESHSFAVKTLENEGLEAPTLKLPKPKRHRTSDGTITGIYSGTVKIILACRIKAHPWNIEGYVQYQACDKTKCFFPARKRFAFSSSSEEGFIERLSDFPPEPPPESPDIGEE